MSRRQFTLLLAPSIVFLFFSVGALFISVNDAQVWQNTVQREPEFQGFVDDVRSGKRQPTTEQWIDFVSIEHDSAKRQGELLYISARTLRDFGLFSLTIAALHFWLVLSVRKDLLKR
jgi:hypothetical protein